MDVVEGSSFGYLCDCEQTTLLSVTVFSFVKVVNMLQVLDTVPGTYKSFTNWRLLVFSLTSFHEETKGSRDVKQFAQCRGDPCEAGIQAGVWGRCIAPALQCLLLVIPSLAGSWDLSPTEMGENDFKMRDACSLTPKHFSVCYLKTRTFSFRTAAK